MTKDIATTTKEGQRLVPANPETRILIIEDSPTQAEIIAGLVEQFGFAAVVCREITASVSQLIATERPDLVLLDLCLLDKNGKLIGDGFQICREIKQIPGAPPVIIVSAERGEEATVWARLQGADGFLGKPFAVEQFKEVVGEVLTTR